MFNSVGRRIKFIANSIVIPYKIVTYLGVILLLGFGIGSIFVWRGVVGKLSVKREYLYYPSNWDAVSKLELTNVKKERKIPAVGRVASGGSSYTSSPVRIMYYVAKKGDTLSEIAEKFHLTLDTVASVNRTEGRGVHMLLVGEKIKIPSVNGIYLTVRGNFVEFCRKYNVTPDTVLEANGREENVSFNSLRGKRLFFPGVQHKGIERSIVIGVAFRKPVGGILTSGYGFRHDPFTNRIRFHRGVDLAVPIGTPVHCAMDGRILAIGHDRILGNYILVKHPEGFSTLYAHLSRVLVRRGEFVIKGKKIGLVGMTGRATGPHLHFEIRYHGRAINPRGMVPGI